MNLKKLKKQELELLLKIDEICKENNLEYYLAYGTLLGAIRHKGFIPWDTDIDIMVKISHYDKFCKILNKKLPKKMYLFQRENDSSYENLFARVGLRKKAHHKLHIDIFPIVGAPKNELMQKIILKVAYLNDRLYFLKKVDLYSNYNRRFSKKIIAFLLKNILFIIPSKLFVHIFNKLKTLYPIKYTEKVYNISGSYGYKELIPKSYLGEPVKKEFEGHLFSAPEMWDDYLTHIYGDYMVPKKYD